MHSILITGVSGSGKTTVSREAVRTLGLISYDYADFMLKAEPTLADKDFIGTLDEQHRQAIYGKVAAQLSAWFGPENGNQQTILLENHLSVIQDGHIVTFRTTDYKRYNARGLVVVSADPTTIYARRTRDPTRRRTLGSIEQIAEQQCVNQSQAKVVTSYLEIPLVIIENNDRAAAIAALVTWVGEILS